MKLNISFYKQFCQSNIRCDYNLQINYRTNTYLARVYIFIKYKPSNEKLQ